MPSECLNFGPLALGERKTKQIVIENTGEKFGLKFSISQEDHPVPMPSITESSEHVIPKKQAILVCYEKMYWVLTNTFIKETIRQHEIEKKSRRN